MGNSETQKAIIDMLVKNEEATRDLYVVCADKFPVFEKFWKNIAKDEESHAAWIKTLYEKTQGGLVNFSEQRFPTDAIQKTINYLTAEKEKVNQGERSSLDALEVAVHIERGMLEGKFFEVFKEDSMELQIILEALRLGTQQHLLEVQKMWEKEKGGADFEKQSV